MSVMLCINTSGDTCMHEIHVFLRVFKCNRKRSLCKCTLKYHLFQFV